MKAITLLIYIAIVVIFSIGVFELYNLHALYQGISDILTALVLLIMHIRMDKG